MTHPFQDPDPVRAQAARDAAKPMAPREGERVMRRTGYICRLGAYSFAYMQKHGGVSGEGESYDIIAAVDASGRVTRTAEGDVPPAHAPQAGAVKALVWEQADEGAWLGHGVEPCQYYLCFENGSWWHPGDDLENAEEFATLDAAKAAAQADYTASILSALPEGARVVAAGEWAAVTDLIAAAAFLTDRLEEFEPDDTDAARMTRDFYGHVVPAHERLMRHIAAMRRIAGGTK